MIEIATIKSLIEIFKNLLGLIETTKKAKKDLFQNIASPLMERLEPLATEYYQYLYDAVMKLKEDKPDLDEVVNSLRQRRSAIIIARNGILGEAEAFMKKRNGLLDKKARGTLDQLLFNFASAIRMLFFVIDHEKEFLETSYGAPTSLWGSLSDMIKMVKSESDTGGKLIDKEECLVGLRDYAENCCLKLFEAKWADVGKAFGELKLFCAR
jgi:hypothetical protein